MTQSVIKILDIKRNNPINLKTEREIIKSIKSNYQVYMSEAVVSDTSPKK
jgi:hypothetical protein